MIRRYAFVQVDVFTAHVFGGNQLAVFSEPTGLTDAEMQAIALEMNLSETVFVWPTSLPDCAVRLRIFTPTVELPFAGHPTVGAAWVLARQGRLPGGAIDLAFEEGIGRVPIALDGDPAAPTTVWMQHREPAFGPALDQRAAIAAALGLADADLLPAQPICIGSTGVPFLYVPLRSPAEVDRAVLDLRAIVAADVGPHQGVFVLPAPDPARGPGRVYSRMFAGHTLGITEDAATGSASGPLGAYIATRRLVELPEPLEIVSLQGQLMRRPSEVRIQLALAGDRATGVRVGGGAAHVFDGVLTLPDKT